MKKLLYLLLGLCLSLSAAACSPKAPSELKNIPSSSTPSPQEPKDVGTPAPSAGDSEVIDTYREFLSENFQPLSDACYGGISGIGFIDLDCDGFREMLIFDAGASASMGVQFFDVLDGEVECVSANLQPMGDAFGNGHFTRVYVNANYFEDFRLVESRDTKERFFLVESGNGSLEFSYRELIRFGRDSENMLTLSPLFYSREEYNIDSGELIASEYRQDGREISEEEYSSAHAAFLGSIVDLGLDAQGVFAWASDAPEQKDARTQLLTMAEKAIALSENNCIPQ